MFGGLNQGSPQHTLNFDNWHVTLLVHYDFISGGLFYLGKVVCGRYEYFQLAVQIHTNITGQVDRQRTHTHTKTSI